MRFSGKLVIIMALAVTVLLVSNIIAIKPVSLFTLPFEFLGGDLFIVSAAIVCFPVSYIISDILTEVYGFRTARGVIWLGFVCNLLMVFLFWLGDIIPGAVFWEDEGAFEAILGATSWILLGSFTAYLAGEFTNASIMVILKNRTQGRLLWLRTISSTIAGQGIDSIIFFTIAFGASGFWVADDGSWSPGVPGSDLRLDSQERLRNSRHAPHLPGSRLAQAHRKDGRLRQPPLPQPLRHLRRRQGRLGERRGASPLRGGAFTLTSPARGSTLNLSPSGGD